MNRPELTAIEVQVDVNVVFDLLLQEAPAHGQYPPGLFAHQMKEHSKIVDAEAPKHVLHGPNPTEL